MTVITRTRGDTWPDLFARTESGVAVDITNRAYLLTVSSLKNPSASEATAAQQFQVVGVITDAPGGLFKFTPTAAQTNLIPGTYYYDVQETITATGEIRTLSKDKYKITQDITKE